MSSRSGIARFNFKNISFTNFDGDRVEAFCENCGPTFAISPIRGDVVASLNNTYLDCEQCGRSIRVEDGTYLFGRKVIEIFSANRPTRQQARRYAKAVKTTRDLEALSLKSELVGPQFAAATRAALSAKNVWKALKFVAAVGLASATLASGVLDADDVWDRFNDGELFESRHPENSAPGRSTARENQPSKPTKKPGNIENGRQKGGKGEIPPTIEI